MIPRPSEGKHHDKAGSLSFGRESDIPELLMGDILAMRLQSIMTHKQDYVKYIQKHPRHCKRELIGDQVT